MSAISLNQLFIYSSTFYLFISNQWLPRLYILYPTEQLARTFSEEETTKIGIYIDVKQRFDNGIFYDDAAFTVYKLFMFNTNFCGFIVKKLIILAKLEERIISDDNKHQSLTIKPYFKFVDWNFNLHNLMKHLSGKNEPLLVVLLQLLNAGCTVKCYQNSVAI